MPVCSSQTTSPPAAEELHPFPRPAACWCSRHSHATATLCTAYRPFSLLAMPAATFPHSVPPITRPASSTAADYWGEHIHLGYYNDEERRRGYKKKNFIQAKYDFVEEMLKWSGAAAPQKVLDVGCGIGGTSRYLADKFRDASVTGGAA